MGCGDDGNDGGGDGGVCVCHGYCDDVDGDGDVYCDDDHGGDGDDGISFDVALPLG